MVDTTPKKKPTLSRDFDRFAELRVFRDAARTGLPDPWPQAAVIYDRALRGLRERFGCSDQELKAGPVETDFGECRSVFEFSFDDQDKARFDLKLPQTLDRFAIVDGDSKRLLAGGIPINDYDALASKLTECFKKRWMAAVGTPKALPVGEDGAQGRPEETAQAQQRA